MDRRALLRALIDERFHANVAEFARAIKKAPAQVHQWLSGNRALGNAGARDIEIRLNLGQGYFDHAQPPHEPQPIAPGPTGAPAEPTLQTLLDALAARLAQADPSIRQEIAQLVMRYMENPQAGARIAAAVELLLEKHAPDDSAL